MAYIDIKYLGQCETCRHHRTGKCDTWCDCGECYQPDMSKIPTADVEEVKHGEWIFVNHSANYLEAPCGDTCRCSICGYEIDVAETYFKRCPMCEAKMDGGKSE